MMTWALREMWESSLVNYLGGENTDKDDEIIMPLFTVQFLKVTMQSTFDRGQVCAGDTWSITVWDGKPMY